MRKSPLATVLRPSSLADFIGQKHLVGDDSPIKQMLDQNQISSMIFWGPPASGKTTLAKIIANQISADFHELSAVMDGKDELRKIVQISKQNQSYGKQTILFIDEIHRWNKAQQDALLPYVESGQINLIGATTENPSFEIVSALLSRTRVFVFNSHTKEDIFVCLKKALKHLRKDLISLEKSDFHKVELDALEILAQLSNGDIRFALNTLELVFQGQKSSAFLSPKNIIQASQKPLRYDKNAEEHYNLISAVHKSLRSSNPSASVYWILRMLKGGEDPLYVARRLIRFASEDIGNSAPNAIVLANAVYDVCHKLGMPECQVALVQLVEYLARCPKNNSAYTATNLALSDVEKFGNLPVPLHFRNAPTKFMQSLGYGENYEYDHDLNTKKSTQECFPAELKGRNYF